MCRTPCYWQSPIWHNFQFWLLLFFTVLRYLRKVELQLWKALLMACSQTDWWPQLRIRSHARSIAPRSSNGSPMAEKGKLLLWLRICYVGFKMFWQMAYSQRLHWSLLQEPNFDVFKQSILLAIYLALFLPLTQSHLLNEFSSELILLNIVGKISTMYIAILNCRDCISQGTSLLIIILKNRS